jgi:hypothetical protein
MIIWLRVKVVAVQSVAVAAALSSAAVVVVVRPCVFRQQALLAPSRSFSQA